MNFKPIIDALKDHLWVNDRDIMLPTPMDYDDEFMIMGKLVEVISSETALEEIKEYYESQGKTFDTREISSNAIGFHRRLGNTNYFFRWL